jgi:hypothetical protein
VAFSGSVFRPVCVFGLPFSVTHREFLDRYSVNEGHPVSLTCFLTEAGFHVGIVGKEG